jgi:hypothetical protein
MNQFLHFLEDHQFLLMDNYLFFLVAYGKIVKTMSLNVVLIYLERIIIVNHHFQYQQINNQFWLRNFVHYFLRNKTLKVKVCLNNHII